MTPGPQGQHSHAGTVMFRQTTRAKRAPQLNCLCIMYTSCKVVHRSLMGQATWAGGVAFTKQPAVVAAAAAAAGLVGEDATRSL